MQITPHAQARMQQRAVRERDLALIFQYGTEFEDGLILRDRDVDEAVSAMRESIKRLEKLRRKAVILDGDTMLTTYSPSKKRLKRFLRQQN